MEEVSTDPTIELPELTQDWEAYSWRAQTKLCVDEDPIERSSDPETDPALPVRIQESLAEVWVGSGLL